MSTKAKSYSKFKERFRAYLSPIKSLIPFIIVFIYLILSYSFIEKKSNAVRCTQIKLNVVDSTKNHFITKNDINIILKKNHFSTIGYPFKEINTLSIEKAIEKHPSIENAEVYNTIRGELKIRIKQREPVIRIITTTGESFYIDNNNFMMPLSPNYTARVPIVSGDITKKYSDYRSLHIATKSDTLLHQLFLLSFSIKENKFWKSIINQIIISKEEGIVLIPQTGARKIILGETPHFDRDLKILTHFYQKVLPKVGWNYYKSIDLRYHHQIVCKRIETWKRN